MCEYYVSCGNGISLDLTLDEQSIPVAEESILERITRKTHTHVAHIQAFATLSS